MKEKVPFNPEIYEESLQEAMAALIDNSQEYWDLIQALRDKKPLPEVIKETMEATGEVRTDLEFLVPAFKNTAHALRTGVSTSEYKMYSRVNKWLTVFAILMPAIDALLVGLAQMFPDLAHSFGSSMWFSGVMLVAKTYLSDRYARIRAGLKKSAIESPFEVEVVDR